MKKIFLVFLLISLFSCNKAAKERAEQRIHDSVAVVYKAYIDSVKIVKRREDSIEEHYRKKPRRPGSMYCENGTMFYVAKASSSKSKTKSKIRSKTNTKLKAKREQ
ncbi:hypothetical protein DRF65_02250 [Chryseobacterium pennae]|uniref:Lipoprotein n=1 Tax=Chryseobacterium pennae TaxID=2258962 RepID=A0A3D9CFF3_9FLAO|nr:hypothetical protein [Chryseobacterium pennae]REC64416.1 hypothetical protein DRF65_02250 [Chryseobacterium pennae]